jgi:hypothetical protein
VKIEQRIKTMNTKMSLHGQRLAAVWKIFGLFVLMLVPILGSAEEEEDEYVSFDGLVVVEGSRVYRAYIDPDADFSVFERVAILDTHVAFRSNWQRDVNRSRSRNVRASDMERIKEDVAGLFKDVFTEQLEAAGFEVVNYAGEDVLVLRPAIVDLDITAPDTRSAGRSRTYTANSGAATLYIELFDSLSGAIIGRAADRRGGGRAGGFATVSNRVTNRADARREFRVWADKLIEFLNEHYVEGNPEAEAEAE